MGSRSKNNKKKNTASKKQALQRGIEPQPQQHKIVGFTEKRESIQVSRGPLPPPAILAQYDQITPGLADRIVCMAEEQAAHQRGIESGVLEAQVEDSKCDRDERRRGQYLAFLIAIAMTGCGTYLVANGTEISGTIIGGGGITGVVMAFLDQRRKSDAVDAADEKEAPPDKQETTPDPSG